jgi:hypothetical protein
VNGRRELDGKHLFTLVRSIYSVFVTGSEEEYLDRQSLDPAFSMDSSKAIRPSLHELAFGRLYLNSLDFQMIFWITIDFFQFRQNLGHISRDRASSTELPAFSIRVTLRG